MREVAAEAEKPVMLYSVGKDSAVMLHLAMKAFAPGKPPFPLLHVNTTWKFREMIAFRDRRVKELGLELHEWINRDGLARGINPFDHGGAYTDIMKTDALKAALDHYGFDVAFGGARRDEEKSRAKERIFSFRSAGHRWDPKSQRQSSGTSTIPARTREKRSGSSRSRTGPSSTSGSTFTRRAFQSSRSTMRRCARSWSTTA